jgi:hypothetical protein
LKTGSYHHWNYAEKLGTITFMKAGLNLITLHISGGMNYAYLESQNNNQFIEIKIK